jgi:myo-inositol-1(or 4)-monophosphatase
MNSLVSFAIFLMPMENLLNETIEITRRAGAVIMGFYRDAFAVTDKTPDNPVTDADLAADRLLREELLALLPEAGWLSEETVDSPERLARRYTWVVDPLDGTKEFVLGIPEFAVSVALVEAGEPVLAAILNPPTGELFACRRGEGVTLNGRPVAPSDRLQLAGSRVDASRSENNRGEFEPFVQLFELTVVGSIAYKLARVAAGLSDATWSRGPKNEWDICAGALLVNEAGGRCVDLDNNAFRFNQARPKVNGIMADNGRIHRELVALLREHGPARLD